MKRTAAKFGSRLAFGLCLVLCFTALSAGCRSGKRLQEYADVSGRVLYKGNPLPGGMLTFIAIQGDAATTTIIGENGTYSIHAPVGEVKIGVDNTMISPAQAGKPKREAATRGAGPRPGAPEPEKVKGQYVNIPAKYRDPNTSGLGYNVKKEEKTHDIELTD